MRNTIEHVCDCCGHRHTLSSEWRGRPHVCDACGHWAYVLLGLPPAGILMVICVLALRALLSVALLVAMILALTLHDLASPWASLAWWQWILASGVTTLALCGSLWTIRALHEPQSCPRPLIHLAVAFLTFGTVVEWMLTPSLSCVFLVMGYALLAATIYLSFKTTWTHEY